jgi:hypothetical protein
VPNTGTSCAAPNPSGDAEGGILWDQGGRRTERACPLPDVGTRIEATGRGPRVPSARHAKGGSLGRERRSDRSQDKTGCSQPTPAIAPGVRQHRSRDTTASLPRYEATAPGVRQHRSRGTTASVEGYDGMGSTDPTHRSRDTTGCSQPTPAIAPGVRRHRSRDTTGWGRVTHLIAPGVRQHRSRDTVGLLPRYDHARCRNQGQRSRETSAPRGEKKPVPGGAELPTQSQAASRAILWL